jgi:hypothetical protein
MSTMAPSLIGSTAVEKLPRQPDGTVTVRGMGLMPALEQTPQPSLSQ